MRLVVAGAGSIGMRHLRDLAALGERDLWAYDTDEARLDEDWGDLAWVFRMRNLEQLWSHYPDALIICTPPDSHVDLALQAVRRGIHTFIEKPLALSLDDVDRLARTAALRQVVTQVAAPLRYHEPLRVLKERFAKEPPVSAAWWCVYDPMANRPDWLQSYAVDTGVILDVGSHEVDIAQFILGPAKFKGAVILAALPGYNIDTSARLLLKHESGCISDISLAWANMPYRRDAEFFRQGKWTFDPAEHEAAYRREMQSFLAACRGEREPENPVSEASRTLALLLEAKRWAEQ